MKRIIVDTIGLSTPKGRLLFFGIASSVIFVVPQSLLGELSLWARLGFESAPSIGLTRAYQYVLHGDLAAAWLRNPLIFVVLAIGLPLLARDATRLMKPKHK